MRFFTLLLLIFFYSNLNAGFLSDLFNAITNQNRDSERVNQEVINSDKKSSEDQFSIDKDANTQNEKVFNNDQEVYLDDQDLKLKEKKIYLKYTNYPKRVYINQHFEITLKSIIIDDNLKSIKTFFINGKNFKVINPKPKFKKIDQNSYEAKIYFKITSKDAILPSIRVVAINNKLKKYTKDIQSKAINIIKLKQNPLFNNVIANKLDITNHKEKRYDDKSILVLMEINATNSNLEDFHLSFAKREALDSFEEHLSWQKVYYVCVIPKYQKEFKFKYFNALNGKFVRVSFPVILADATLSTQLGLDPKKSKFFLYKVIAMLFVALLFILMYIRYKSYFALTIGIAIMLYVVFTKLITSTITINKDINIRILPTQNSTIFFKTPKKIDAKVILKKRGYTKVLLPNGKIGWIKDDELKKD